MRLIVNSVSRGQPIACEAAPPAPPNGGTGPRETLFEINRVLAFLHALPLGEVWVELATPEFQGICG